jgi:hypothetical protein
MQQNNKKIRLLIVCLIALVILLIAGSIHSYQNRQVGTIVINYNLSSMSGVRATFNGYTATPVSTTASTQRYTLRHGNYVVRITLAGYKDFSTTLSLRTGETLTVDPSLSLSSNPVLSSASQIVGLNIPASQISTETYFYARTWVAVTLTLPGTDPAVAVAQYVPASQTWQLQLGPGTDFSQTSINSLPQMVQEFLQSNLYVESGAY